MQNVVAEVYQSPSPSQSPVIYKLILTETRTDGAGNQYPFSTVEMTSEESVDQQIASTTASYEANLAVLQAKKDAILAIKNA